MPPKKHNVKRMRHTARRTFRLTTGYGVRMQRLTVRRGAPYGREAEHCRFCLCIYIEKGEQACTALPLFTCDQHSSSHRR
nr:MAG TPA: hypothetical protein [Caudoviricetes sp.]